MPIRFVTFIRSTFSFELKRFEVNPPASTTGTPCGKIFVGKLMISSFSFVRVTP